MTRMASSVGRFPRQRRTPRSARLARAVLSGAEDAGPVPPPPRGLAAGARLRLAEARRGRPERGQCRRGGARSPAGCYGIGLTGEHLMLQEELDTVSQGIGLVGLISLLLVAFILGFGLRSLWLVLSVIVTLDFGPRLDPGLCGAGGRTAQSDFRGLCRALHRPVRRFRHSLRAALPGNGRAGEPTPAALNSGAARLVGPALLLCAPSPPPSAFFAFQPTAYRGLSELGLISGAGMFIALFANLHRPAGAFVLPRRVRCRRRVVPPGGLCNPASRRRAAPQGDPVGSLCCLLAGRALAALPFRPASTTTPSICAIRPAPRSPHSMPCSNGGASDGYRAQVLAPGSRDRANRTGRRPGRAAGSEIRRDPRPA